MLGVLGMAGYVAFVGVIAAQMWRMDTARRLPALPQLGAGSIGVLTVMFPIMIFAVTAFRVKRDPAARLKSALSDKHSPHPDLRMHRRFTHRVQRENAPVRVHCVEDSITIGFEQQSSSLVTRSTNPGSARTAATISGLFQLSMATNSPARLQP